MVNCSTWIEATLTGVPISLKGLSSLFNPILAKLSIGYSSMPVGVARRFHIPLSRAMYLFAIYLWLKCNTYTISYVPYGWYRQTKQVSNILSAVVWVEVGNSISNFFSCSLWGFLPYFSSISTTFRTILLRWFTSAIYSLWFEHSIAYGAWYIGLNSSFVSASRRAKLEIRIRRRINQTFKWTITILTNKYSRFFSSLLSGVRMLRLTDSVIISTTRRTILRCLSLMSKGSVTFRILTDKLMHGYAPCCANLNFKSGACDSGKHTCQWVITPFKPMSNYIISLGLAQ